MGIGNYDYDCTDPANRDVPTQGRSGVIGSLFGNRSGHGGCGGLGRKYCSNRVAGFVESVVASIACVRKRAVVCDALVVCTGTGITEFDGTVDRPGLFIHGDDDVPTRTVKVGQVSI